MKGIEAKIVVLGSQGVGKTSMVARYVANHFSKEVAPTIGASFFSCKVNLEDTSVKMQVWDTAGQERFKAMAPMYYRNANASLLVFDISQYSSFVEIKAWVQELQRTVQEPMVLSLVGNKIDLEQQRAVSREEAFLYSASIGATYFETSVVNDQGIEQVFISTALGLIRLSCEPTCSTIQRYESMESVATTPSQSQLNGAVQIGIPVDPQTPATGLGRLERPTWSIDHIAHGSEGRVGWCCF